MPSTSLISSSTSGSKLQNNALLTEYTGPDCLTPLFLTTIGPGQLILEFLRTLKDVGSLAGIKKVTNQFIINAKIDKQALLQEEIDALTPETPQGRVKSLFIALVRSPNGIQESIQQRTVNMTALLKHPSLPLPNWPSWIAKEIEGKKPKPTSEQIQHLCSYLIKHPFRTSPPKYVIQFFRLFKPFAKGEVAAISKEYLESAVQKKIKIAMIDKDRRIDIHPGDWVGPDSFASEIEQVEAVFLRRIDFLQQQQSRFALQVRLIIHQEGEGYCASLANKIKNRDKGDREIGYQEIRRAAFSDTRRRRPSPQHFEVLNRWYTVSLKPLDGKARLEESKN